MGFFDKLKTFFSRKHPASGGEVEPQKEKTTVSPSASTDRILEVKTPEIPPSLEVKEAVRHTQTHPVLEVKPKISEVKPEESTAQTEGESPTLKPKVQGEGVTHGHEVPTLDEWLNSELAEVRALPERTKEERDAKEKAQIERGVFINSKGAWLTEKGVKRFVERFFNRPTTLKEAGALIGGKPKVTTLGKKPTYALNLEGIKQVEVLTEREKLAIQARKAKKKAETN